MFIVAPDGALAQANTGEPQVPLVLPPGAIRQIPTRFDVVNAPAQFDQVLQIIDFPSGTWTPLHTPGGYVYTTVIDGAIITRSTRWGDVYEAAYQAGDTFVERPGDYVQVGNASTRNTRIMATALLPAQAPLTVYQDGFTSNAYPTLTSWNYAHDMDFAVPGPETIYRSVTAVDRPEGTVKLVQLMLDTVDLPPLLNLGADERRESCVTAWRRMSWDVLRVYPNPFERVAANLCVSSGYMPGPDAPSRAGAPE